MTNPAGLDGEGRLQARLLELARETARNAHDDAWRMEWDASHKKHVGQMSDGHLSIGEFDTCPHPDCVLVRSVPAAPPPQAPMTPKERHLMDVYAALGVEWGHDVFAAIAALKVPPPQEQPQENPCRE